MRNVQRELRKLQQTSQAGAVRWALLTQRRSQIRTPIETGNLRASHRVVSEEHGDIFEVAVGCGGISPSGENLDYAVPVHERLDVHHPVGEAKFLEKAVREGIPDVVPMIRGGTP
jgi:hypothetical protein